LIPFPWAQPSLQPSRPDPVCARERARTAAGRGEKKITGGIPVALRRRRKKKKKKKKQQQQQQQKKKKKKERKEKIAPFHGVNCRFGEEPL